MCELYAFVTGHIEHVGGHPPAEQDKTAVAHDSVGLISLEAGMDQGAPHLQRLQLLAGPQGMDKLKKAAVAVIGLGGVGSHAVEALARSGVGRLVLVDMDRIEISNINRQLPALTSTIGEYKTEAVAQRIHDIDPSIQVSQFTCRFEPASSEDILSSGVDYVIDAIDSLPDKTHLIISCLEKGIPVVSSMGMANRLDPSMIRIGDIKETHVCPVARIIRKELRSRGIDAGVKVVYSIEKPVKPWEDKQGTLGSIIYLPGIAGYLLTSIIIEEILLAG